MSMIAEAVEKKKSGRYNCAQSVLCTYCGATTLDESQALSIAAAFGTGMGCVEGTCGALVGAGMVLGFSLPDRVASMKAMSRVMNSFKERNGSTVCRELKGIGTGMPLRACNDCVADAAGFLERELELIANK